MRSWKARIPIVAAVLVLLFASAAPPSTALCASGLGSAPPAVDEALVFQTIRSSVTELQAALHRKVASILTSKVSGGVSGTSYESTWQVTVRYYLDYPRADDVPYLKGMLKCLAECGASAPKDWVGWAEIQVETTRDSLAEEIAFQQELRMRVLVKASLDASGRLMPSTLKAFHVVSDSETISINAEALAAPGDKQLEQAGYYFLRDRLDAQTSTSGGAAPPPQSGSQSPGSQSSGSQAPASQYSDPQPSGTQQSSSPAAKTGTQGTSWSSADPNRRILLIGIGVLLGLILLLVLNQRLLRRSRG